ncbi:MAG: hypothetical protein RRC07_13835 [Anaerolineae bacterium]|nr:hypothetical protein [Anaerolineae bacterium]
MIRETAYYAYLLRMARYGSKEVAVWRISLESPETRQQLVFSSLNALCRFLEIQMETEMDCTAQAGSFLTAVTPETEGREQLTEAGDEQPRE